MSWILEHCRLEKEFTERESGRRQRFIRAPLREETNSRWLSKGAQHAGTGFIVSFIH
jgi:hypothetical protein